VVARPQEPKPTLCHLAFVIRHLAFVIWRLAFAIDPSDRIGEATGSPWLAVVPWHDRGEPIGVVKLLGC
jgi:hypothetical protein